ncbi:MAG TPA: methionine--tRNA ligase [Acholeplasmataceae bacterium]|jgi:methionyl-tRNA synthetase|nr:methionine--tRNA ligase [Acholeplasmataceae bacterium]
MSKKKTCYVTTPIYYASGNVHIGNSYTTLACDAFVRFNRLRGRDTFYLTGMDEHGQKIENAAKSLGRAPQEHVNIIAEETKALWKELNIDFDDFIQTSEERHVLVVQKIFEKLLKSGDIYLGKYEGDYCVYDEAFFTKTQLNSDGTCPDCGRPTTKVQEECYFLNLKKYQQKLLDYIRENPDFIQPETRKNEVVSFVERGLEDLAISRTTFKWGVPVLSNPRHVVYVWIDALSNYISALGYLAEDDSKFKKYWLEGDEVVHVIGKDILRFHAVYWPIMLLALGVPIRFKLYVHGWVLMKEGKMSKSKGNVIYPRDVINRYGLDSLRYYLLREMPLGNDCIFSYDKFIEKYNVDLANDLGNLVSRTISMINKYFKGVVIRPKKTYFSEDEDLRKVAEASIAAYLEAFENFRLQNGIIAVWNLVNRSNKYIDETTPWLLFKDETKREALNSVMYHLFESIRLIALMIAPVIPDSAEIIFKELGLDREDFSALKFGITAESKVAEKVKPLFQRLDLEAEMKYHEAKNEEELQTKPEITIEDFNKLDLRIGEILAAEKVKAATKLLLLKVKIDEEIRTIVSGIAEYYRPEELVGKKVALIANLKPVKIKGHLSQGMLLCAEGEGKPLEILEVFKNDSKSRIL